MNQMGETNIMDRLLSRVNIEKTHCCTSISCTYGVLRGQKLLSITVLCGGTLLVIPGQHKSLSSIEIIKTLKPSFVHEPL